MILPLRRACCPPNGLQQNTMCNDALGSNDLLIDPRRLTRGTGMVVEELVHQDRRADRR